MQLLEGLDYLDGDPGELGFSFSDIGKAIGTVAKGAADIATAPARLVGDAIGGDVGKAIKTVGTLPAAPVEILVSGALGGSKKKKSKASATARAAGVSPAVAAKLRAAQAQARARVAARDSGTSSGSLAEKARIAAQLKPRISAKSTRSPSASKKSDPALVAAIAAKVNARLDPKLAKIHSMLKLAANQRQATYEHDVIKNTGAYRRKVLGDLMRLAATLPPDHPTRQRIVKVGLLSGLL